MGYTHYWNHTRKFSRQDWIRVEDALSLIVEGAIRRGYTLSIDHGASSISAHTRTARAWLTEFGAGPVIQINGVAPNSCETFVIHKEGVSAVKPWQNSSNKGFDFCKTNQHPYDTVVTAMLIWLISTFPKHISARSDGNLEDWQSGMDLCLFVFGENSAINYLTRCALPRNGKRKSCVAKTLHC